MVPVDQGRDAFVTPGFRVEMQAKHEVGAQPGINEFRSVPYLAVPVEKDFTLPPNGLIFERIVRPIEILLWGLFPFAFKTRGRPP